MPSLKYEIKCEKMRHEIHFVFMWMSKKVCQ